MPFKSLYSLFSLFGLLLLDVSKISVFVLYQLMCVCVKSFQLCLTLCDPMDHSLPGSSVHGILQARILEGVAICFSWGSSWLRDQNQTLSLMSPALAGRFFTTSITWEAHQLMLPVQITMSFFHFWSFLHQHPSQICIISTLSQYITLTYYSSTLVSTFVLFLYILIHIPHIPIL